MTVSDLIKSLDSHALVLVRSLDNSVFVGLNYRDLEHDVLYVYARHILSVVNPAVRCRENERGIPYVEIIVPGGL